MKQNYFLVFVTILCLMLASCKKNVNKENTIIGLWIVEKVMVGKNKMTPIARWMQFNKDSTQTSGNGWLKHSYGTWNLNDKNQLRITNSNGLSDEADPFLIDVKKGKMIWQRNEEGQNVQVHLTRVEEKPASPGNEILGLWKLESFTVSGKDISNTANPKNNQTLYLSWDNVFREHNLLKGRRVGIYKIHGHRPELQMVNYGKNPVFSFWDFSITKNKLKLISKDTKTIKIYRRIYKFLQ
ncbi:MAG: hypothetical protein HWD85_01770 [Flavobacteriaceae bacterium]|nr:hypothetical protein [Flavobacteriaceae bacterium]